MATAMIGSMQEFQPGAESIMADLERLQADLERLQAYLDANDVDKGKRTSVLVYVMSRAANTIVCWFNEFANPKAHSFNAAHTSYSIMARARTCIIPYSPSHGLQARILITNSDTPT